jgi:hypothetical protein
MEDENVTGKSDDIKKNQVPVSLDRCGYGLARSVLSPWGVHTAKTDYI